MRYVNTNEYKAKDLNLKRNATRSPGPGALRELLFGRVLTEVDMARFNLAWRSNLGYIWLVATSCQYKG